ncbi:MAG: dipeptide ABC transporter ATP-binding protein [Gammaproteobacteria bacterium]|nr:MAG: dipeptide ABC transporter ATP-binding protein [Gammaproteobacteria bacterium]
MTKIHAIAASALSKTYDITSGFFNKKESLIALEEISFTLLEGDTLGILGESGAGKSTLAKLLVGAETPSSGLLLIDSKDVTNLTTRERLSGHRKVRIVYQDPYASLNPRLTISSLLDEPLRNVTKLSKQERRKLIIKVLNLVGLKSEHGRRLPHMFSAGERQRIAIARALILDPVCIVLDEPLSSLDISVQSQIVNLMLELQKNLDLSYVLITYNLPVIKHMCDQLMVLCDGRMVEYGPTASVLESPKHPYTQDILNKKSKTSSSSTNVKKQYPGCNYCDRCNYVSEHCYSDKPQQHLMGSQLVSCHKVEQINNTIKIRNK